MNRFEHFGGRSIEDIEQYWYSILSAIKETYPVNEAPVELVIECKNLIDRAENLVKDGRIFLDKLQDKIEWKNKIEWQK
jgi:hypothetical protein